MNQLITMQLMVRNRSFVNGGSAKSTGDQSQRQVYLDRIQRDHHTGPKLEAPVLTLLSSPPVLTHPRVLVG